MRECAISRGGPPAGSERRGRMVLDHAQRLTGSAGTSSQIEGFQTNRGTRRIPGIESESDRNRVTLDFSISVALIVLALLRALCTLYITGD
jgi:hypothetical protein